MLLSEGTARKVVFALENAATKAKNTAKTEEASAAYALMHPPMPMPPNDSIGAYNARQTQRCECAKKAQASIVEINKILEGVVYLASGQHMAGISRLEATIEARQCTLPKSDPRQTEVYLNHEAVKCQDLPALCNNGRVKPGLLNRLYKGEIKYSYGAPYAREMLEVISMVQKEISVALEAKATVHH